MKREKTQILKEDAIIKTIDYVVAKSDSAKAAALLSLVELASEYNLTRSLKQKEEKRCVLECLSKMVSIDYPLSETINNLINSIKCNNT